MSMENRAQASGPIAGTKRKEAQATVASTTKRQEASISRLTNRSRKRKVKLQSEDKHMPIVAKVQPREHVLPPLKDGQQRHRVFPWNDLSINDWFYIPRRDFYLNPGHMAGVVMGLARNQEKKSARRFMIMQVGQGVRVYRIK